MPKRIEMDLERLRTMRENNISIEACARALGHNRTTVRDACRRMGLGGKLNPMLPKTETNLGANILEISQKYLQMKLVNCEH